MKYVAQKPFRIEQTTFQAGDEVGTGDVGAGKFAPSDSAPFVEVGHILPRLASGLIAEVKDSPAPKPVDPKPETKPARTKKKKGNSR